MTKICQLNFNWAMQSIVQLNNYTILLIDNSPQWVLQWKFTILEEIKSTWLKSLFTNVFYKSNQINQIIFIERNNSNLIMQYAMCKECMLLLDCSVDLCFLIIVFRFGMRCLRDHPKHTLEVLLYHSWTCLLYTSPSPRDA